MSDELQLMDKDVDPKGKNSTREENNVEPEGSSKGVYDGARTDVGLSIVNILHILCEY